MFERSFEIGQILVMKGSRQVLVKEVLFCLGGRGQLQDNATPSFSPDSKSSILGLSNEVSSVSRFFWKKGENREKENSIIWPNVSNWRTLYLLLSKEERGNTLKVCFILSNYPHFLRTNLLGEWNSFTQTVCDLS